MGKEMTTGYPVRYALPPLKQSRSSQPRFFYFLFSFDRLKRMNDNVSGESVAKDNGNPSARHNDKKNT